MTIWYPYVASPNHLYLTIDAILRHDFNVVCVFVTKGTDDLNYDH